MSSKCLQMTSLTMFNAVHLVQLVVCNFSSGRCHKKHKFLSIPPKNVPFYQCSFCPRDKIHTGKREVSNTWVWILSRGVITRHLKTFLTLFMRSLDFHFTIRVTPLFNNVQGRTLGTVGSLSFSSGRCHKKHHDYKFLSIPCIIPRIWELKKGQILSFF